MKAGRAGGQFKVSIRAFAKRATTFKGRSRRLYTAARYLHFISGLFPQSKENKLVSTSADKTPCCGNLPALCSCRFCSFFWASSLTCTARVHRASRACLIRPLPPHPFLYIGCTKRVARLERNGDTAVERKRTGCVSRLDTFEGLLLVHPIIWTQQSRRLVDLRSVFTMIDSSI